MTQKIKNINLNPGPYLKEDITLSYMMKWTGVALLFPALGSIYYFGFRAFWLILVCLSTAVITEIFCKFLTGRNMKNELGSAVVTGLILSLILPADFPFWAAAVGAVFSIVVVKYIFGGTGKNIFNPALMARAFLTAAFPILITTYGVAPRPLFITDSNTSKVGAVTGATPLTEFKFEDNNPERVKIIAGEKIDGNNFLRYFLGSKRGSSGETSALLILIGLAVLVVKKVIDWRLPVSYFSTVIALSTIIWLIRPDKFLDPLSTLLLGGVLLGGTYMITDPVTTPVTGKGKWVFGIGTGLLTLIIRNFSGYPEGVMFSILLMNAVTPLINRFTRPRIYGT